MRNNQGEPRLHDYLISESRVNCCSSPIASGKTTGMIERADELVDGGEKVLIVAPTKVLVDQIARDLGGEDVLVASVHEDTQRHPTGWIIEHSRTDMGREPQAIITTHAALPYLLEMDDRARWHLMVDEALQVVRAETRLLPITRRYVTDVVEVGETVGRFSRLTPIDRKRVEEMSRMRDDMLAVLREPYRLLASEAWEVWVNADRFSSLRDGASDGVLDLHAAMRPDVLRGWASVLVAGACLEDTVMHRIWSSRGIAFVPDEKFCKRLNFAEHDCGLTMEVRCATSRRWSRQLLNTRDGAGRRNLDLLVDATLGYLPDDFLYGINVRERDIRRGTRAPSAPHGLNKFAHINDVAFLSSLNPSPEHWAFLREVAGMTDEEIRRAHVDLAAYQLVGRGSVRRRDCQERRRVVVPDLCAAEFMARQFPGIDIGKLPGIELAYPMLSGRPRGRPRVNPASPMTAAERMRRMRERRKTEMH
jgi:hypothetical protein